MGGDYRWGPGYGAPQGQYYPPGGAYPPQGYPPSSYPSAGYSQGGYSATGYPGAYPPPHSGYGAPLSGAVAGFGGAPHVSHGSHHAHGLGQGHGHGHYGGKFSHGKHYGGGSGHGGKFYRKYK